jgi:tellurite methyltransferase
MSVPEAKDRDAGPILGGDGQRFINGPGMLMSGDDRSTSSWRDYYTATAGRPPRPTLLFALDRFAAPGRAADLGCGDGRDTIELLRRGWSVMAIDSEPDAIARLRARSDLPPAAVLDARCARFEDADWGEVALVNASFALPICPPERFAALWAKITRSLCSGGRFAGQLYGTRDSWAERRGMTFLDRDTALRLLDAYAVELFEEEESDSVTPRGEKKHWHIYHVVARKA